MGRRNPHRPKTYWKYQNRELEEIKKLLVDITKLLKEKSQMEAEGEEDATK